MTSSIKVITRAAAGPGLILPAVRCRRSSDRVRQLVCERVMPRRDFCNFCRAIGGAPSMLHSLKAANRMDRLLLKHGLVCDS